MATANLTITLAELPGVLDEVARETEPKDLKPLLETMSVYLSATAKRRFHEGIDPDGAIWKPLAMQRARPRDKVNRNPRSTGQKPLRDTGLLMASVTGGAGGFVNIGDTWLEQGTNLEYAAFHQFGVGPIRPVTKKALFWPGAAHPVKGTKGIPARPFLGINDRDADKLALMTADYFSGDAMPGESGVVPGA